jgi:predicted SprT family Zn-dependent metalloprotease
MITTNKNPKANAPQSLLSIEQIPGVANLRPPEINLTIPPSSTDEMKMELVRDYATGLLSNYGLIGWSFGFDRALCRLGKCYRNKRRITLSWNYVCLNPAADIQDTVLHEIAHALVPYTVERKPHGPIWRKTALAIGCNGEVTGNAIMPQPRMPKHIYTYACINCGREGRRRRRFQGVCGSCCKKYNQGKYDARFKLRLVHTRHL